jgi:hypothetical protein
MKTSKEKSFKRRGSERKGYEIKSFKRKRKIKDLWFFLK